MPSLWKRGRLAVAGVVGLLLLPVAAPAQETWRYAVEPGDTLISIARRHLLSESHWRQIQRINRVADPRRLLPGSTLVLPLPITRVEPATARLLVVSGKVELIRGGVKSSAASGQALQPGDELVSAADSNASVEFADGSQARVLAGSHVKLAQMQRLGQSKVFSTEIELKQGRVESTVKPVPRGAQNYLIRTPSVNLGVRGTEFRAVAETAEVSRTEVVAGLVGAANPAGKVEVAAGFGTVVKANSPPEKPRPLLPAPDLSQLAQLRIERLPIAFAWPAVGGASAYRVQVARDASFAEIVADALADKPETRLQRDIADGKYAVRVRAIDAAQLEGKDAVAELTVKARPLPPLTEQPANKSIVHGDGAEFRWTSSEEARAYRVQVAGSDDFANPAYDATIEATTASAPLPPGDYFWRMAAIRAEGDQGPFGQINRFTLKKMPAFNAPAMDAREMTFEWSQPEPGQQFRFQLARNRDFDPLLLERKLTDAKIALPRPVRGELFMRIAVIEADGAEAPFGAVQSVKLPPFDLRIAYSVDAQLINFRWPAILRPGWKYQWQIARDEAFVELVRDETIESSIPSIARPLEGGTFYARARVIDESGEAGDYAAVTRIDVPARQP